MLHDIPIQVDVLSVQGVSREEIVAQIKRAAQFANNADTCPNVLPTKDIACSAHAKASVDSPDD
jgi:hypothetical protein